MRLETSVHSYQDCQHDQSEWQLGQGAYCSRMPK